MIRKIKDGQEYKEAKIISTDDIYVGTDVTASLGEVIDAHEDKLKKLEKWTKWYVKYGGMGSGSGGGGTSVKFGYKVYFKRESTVQEATGSTVNLWGNGTYTIMFNLTKTQGHSFTIRYFIGDSNPRSLIIPEGSSTAEIQATFNTKTIFGFTIIDTNTDDEDEKQFTVIPESFAISPLINYRSGGSVVKNSPISFDSLTDNLVAIFNATIFEAIPVYWQIRWKVEDELNWHIFDEGVFEYSSGGETRISTVTRDLSFIGLEEEAVLGKEITIDLLYGLEQGSYSPTEAGSYTMTVVPDGFYLLLTDPEKRLYIDEPEDPTSETINKLKRGYLPFYVNLCYESDSRDVVTISLYRKVNNSWTFYVESSPMTLDTNKTVSMSEVFRLTVADSGLFKIVATSGQGARTEKYFVVKESASAWDYDQYEKTSEGRSGGDNQHFYYEDLDTPFLRNAVELYENSYTKSINIGSLTNTGSYNYNFAIGLQYDKSNDDNVPFIRMTNLNGVNLDIYQNKILFGDSAILDFYYLPKTDVPNVADSSLWHLLNININYARSNSAGTQSYYELSVYIDGVLEGVSKGNVDSTKSTALSNLYKFNSITINPERSQIIKMNLFETNFTIIGDTASFTRGEDKIRFSYSYLYDIYATTYYNKYKSNFVEEQEILDTTNFSSRVQTFKFDEHSMPYTSSDNLSNLISELDANGNNKLLQVPVLILCPNELSQSTSVGAGHFFDRWFSAIWPEDPIDPETQSPKSLSGYIYYIPANSMGNISQFLVKDENQNKVGFTFDIQGSSTRAYGNKNIELSINQTSEAVETVFTPNFHKDDKETFLPEKSFTLKADMVDSSTCNNNAIGAFVNANTLPLDNSNCPARSLSIGDHIKNCLTGFPVLVFLHVDNNDGQSEDKYYFAGIYNFNLGRKSYYNLGYYKTYDNKILNLMTDQEQGIFKFFDVEKPEYNDNLAVTEISNGNRFFDFSQYNTSVLFSDRDSDTRSMFSREDTIYSNEANYRELLSNAVRYIAKGGGYIFDKLRKNLEKIGDHTGMVYKLEKDGISLNCVSDYRQQYRRVPGESSYEEDHVDPSAVANDLLECIGTTIDDLQHTPYLDLRSTVEYYVICMVFGMVDSVLKNMELKSWNTRTIFPAFYDMDTALGVDNSGNNVDFFAFSDYWLNKTETIDGYPDRVRALGVNIYPDFFLENSGYTGYDIPSSYLFAIAKYATMEMIGVKDNIPMMSSIESGSGTPAPLSPVNLYSYYRKLGGVLESADKFIETYFSNRLSHIPNSIKNLNYRSKYAKVAYWQIDAVNGEINDVINSRIVRINQLNDIDKFKGTGTNKKRDWLNSRLHLLDSYFNINGDVKYRVRKADITKDGSVFTSVEWNDIIAEGGGYYYYPQLEKMSVTFSKDVTINTQIFSGQTKSDLSISTLLIQAPSFTPVIFVQSGEDPKPFLIGDDTKELFFNIPIRTVGNMEWGLYGSKNFSYINNLGLFKLNDNGPTSDVLENVNYVASPEVASVTANYSINTPNISALIINNDKYTGEVSLNNNLNYNRLSSIDFSNSRIYCSYNGTLPVTTLNLERLNCAGNTISLPNLPKLSSVNLNNASIGTLILPIWKNNISITKNNSTVQSTAGYDYHSTSVKNLTLTNLKGLNNVVVRLHTMPELEEVNVSGVSELIIDTCINLKSVRIDGSLTRLIIRNSSESSSVNNLKVYVGTGANGIIDLTRCPNLTYLDLYNTRKFNTVKINTITSLPSNAFYNCVELQYLDSGTNGEFRITGTGTFSQCSNFTLKTPDDTYPNVLFTSGLTDASSTFNCSGRSGKIDYGAANYFIKNNRINNRVGSLDTINYWFYSQPYIGESMTFTENSYFERFSEYTALVNTTNAFAFCGIRYWTKELFNFGSNSVSLNGTFYNSNINAKVDFLQNIRNKVTSFTDGFTDRSVTYKFYDSSGNALTTVNMSDVLRLDKATNLASFVNVDANIVDLTNCFNSATKIVNLYWFMRNCTTWRNAIYTVSDEKRSCLWALTDLAVMAECFGQNSLINGSLELYYLLPENKWKTMSNINGVGITTNASWSEFSCAKTVTLSQYNDLVYWLSINQNLTHFGPIFRNCIVTNCDTSPVMAIPYSRNNTKITSVNRTYYSFRAIDNRDDEIPVILDENFFEYLPAVTSCYYTFAQTWIGNTNGLPFNFFYKRSNDIYTDGYSPNITVNSLDVDQSTFEYIYYYSTTLALQPTLPENVLDDRAATEQLDIFSDNRNVNNQWLALGSSIPNGRTNMTRRDLWRAKRYRPRKDPQDPTKTTYGEFGTIEKMEQFDNPTLVSVRYATYNNRNITDVRGMFYNCSYVVPYFKYADGTSVQEDDITKANRFISKYESYIKDAGNNYYDEYYTDQNCTIRGNYRKSIEIDDLRNIVCEKAINVSVAGHVFANYNLAHEALGEPINRPMIPTDFFYGISASCYMDNIFASSVTTYQTSSQQDRYNCLEGYLPNHLFANTSLFNTYENWIANTNVIPVRYKQSNQYVFVPENFINQTLSSINSLFNFHIRVPAYTAGDPDNKEFYILYSNSIKVGSNQVSFNNCLPRYALHGTLNSGIIEDSGREATNVTDNDFNFNYHLILVPSDDPSGTLGYVNQYFPAARYQNMISRDMLYVFSGLIWDPDYILNNIPNNNEPVFGSIITTTGGMHIGINRNLKFPRANDSFVSKHLFESGVNRISRNSLNGDENYWSSTYNNISFAS